MERNKEFYIMGAGDFGHFVYNQFFEFRDFWYMLGFIDSDIHKKNMLKDGKKIFHLFDSEIIKANKNILIFIAITDKKESVRVAYMLNSLGFYNLYEIRNEVFFNNIKFVNLSELDMKCVRRYKTNSNGLILPVFPYLETHVMNGCNLKCQGCSHFSNLLPTEAGVDFGEYEKDILRLGEICDVMRLRLLGGEPLLNDNLLDYLKVARQAFPQADIRIATNGILVSKCGEETLEYMAYNGIMFDITLYKTVLPMKRNIVDRLEKYKVPYNLFENKGEFEKMLTLCGNKDPESNIAICSRKICLTLKGGNLYRCAISAHIDNFNREYGTNIETESLFNIYTDSVERLKKVTLEYPNKPVSTCKYCLNPPVSFLWQSSPEPCKEEWLVQEI